MPDPMDELENFTSPGLTMDPLPAAEVRRRGNRLRRRNTALAAAGGVLAVAVIAAPFAVMAGHTSSSDPDPAPKPGPGVTWQQTIPADFPLSDGMPRATAQDEYVAQADADACDGLGWSPDGPPPTVDVQQIVQTENEGGVDRALALYADDEAAARARQGLQARVRECAAETDGKSRYTEDVSSSASSLVYVDHVSEIGEMYAHQVVQVGNALLLTTVYSMGGGDPAIVQQTADLIERKNAPVVDAMCVFSSTGCGSTSNAVDPTGAAAPATTAIPADFPLLDGLPTTAATKDFGRYGPKPDEETLGVIGCTNDVSSVPGHPAERLSGGWTDPAEERVRQLMTFASTDDASAYVDGITTETTCNPQDAGDGVTEIHSGAGSDLGLGDEALIAVTWYRHNGNPAPGFRITELVRVGNAVVVQTRTADGLNDLVTSAYLEQIIGESDQSLSGVVDAMCVFADSGC